MKLLLLAAIFAGLAYALRRRETPRPHWCSDAEYDGTSWTYTAENEW